MGTQLLLLPAGMPAATPLLPRFEAAQRAGLSAWYWVAGAEARRQRLHELALRLPLLDPPMGTADELALRALGRAGLPLPARLDGRLAGLLLRDAIAAAWPEVAPGPGLERAVRLALGRLRADGWTADSFARTADEVSPAHEGARRLVAIWTRFDELCPEADTAAPLRQVLTRGLLRQDPPALLLIEAGPFAGELEARVLRELVEAVRASGGDIVGSALDLPTPGGLLGRARTALEAALGVRAAPWQGADPRPAPIARLAETLFRPSAPAPPTAPVQGAQAALTAGRAGAGRRAPALQISLFDERAPAPAPAPSAAPLAAPAAEGIVRLTAPDDAATADRIAREIRGLLRSADDPAALLARGVAVVCPTAADARAMEAALREHGLPLTATPREAIAAHPGGRAVMRLLELLAGGAEAPLEPLLELLAADAWALEPDDADRISAELQRGGAVTVTHALAALEAMDDRAARATAARLRRILELAQELERTTSSAQRSALLRSALRSGGKRPGAEPGKRGVLDPQRGGWRRHGLRALGDGHVLTPAVRAAAGSARPLRRLDDLLAALDERARRLGCEASPAEWLAVLRALLQETPLQIGSAPPLGVRLESPGAIDPAGVVFVLGLVERRFPRGPRPEPFVTEPLQGGPDDLAPLLPPRQDADAERERFLLSCSAARDRLYLCYPRIDAEGRELLPSFFMEDVARALGLPGMGALAERRRRLGEVVPEPGLCAHGAELRASLAAALRDPDLPQAQRLTTRRALDEQGAVAGLALTPFSDSPAAVSEPANVAFLHDEAARVSASQLGSYAACAFRHYAEKRLAPETVELPELDAMERGSAMHELLRRFGARGGWSDPAPALAELADAAIPEAPPSLVSGGRNRVVWRRARAGLAEFLERECARLAASEFRPAHHELGFGPLPGERDPASLPDPVAVPIGDDILRFTGSLDRVDVWTDGAGVRWGIAVDYKSGPLDRESKAFAAGDDIQLMVYLRVLPAFGIQPAGALYASLKKDRLVGVVRADFAAAAGFLGREVAVDAAQAWQRRVAAADERMSMLWGRMRTPVIVARPRDWQCWPCELHGLCRTHIWRVRHDV